MAIRQRKGATPLAGIGRQITSLGTKSIGHEAITDQTAASTKCHFHTSPFSIFGYVSFTDEIQIFATTKVPVAVSGLSPISGRRRKRSVEVPKESDDEENSPELHKWWYQKGVSFGSDKKPKFR